MMDLIRSVEYCFYWLMNTANAAEENEIELRTVCICYCVMMVVALIARFVCTHFFGFQLPPPYREG